MAGDVRQAHQQIPPVMAPPSRRAPAQRSRVVIMGFAPTNDSTLVERFCAVGARIQLADHGRIVSATSTIALRLSPDFSFHKHGTAHHFIATRDGIDIGRCSSMINDRAQRDGDARTGYIGMWECIDDSDAANALLDAASAWLAGQRCHVIVGPVDYSTWYGYRFSLGPWDQPALAFEPATPQRYVAQWETYGFSMRRTYVTTVRRHITDGLAAGNEKLAQAIAAGYTFRHIRMRDFEMLLRGMYDHARQAFDDAPDAAPIDWESFRDMYQGLRQIIDPRLVWCAFAPDGSVAGLALSIPNHASALRAMRGRSNRRAKISAWVRMWKARSVLFKTLFVHPDHQGMGLSIALTQRVWQTAHELGFDEVHHTLMHETNSSLAYSERGGTSPFRRYALFELQLGSE